MKRFLPIGSVVLLKGADKRIMIVGFKQHEAETGKIWDYSACLYPEGVLNSDNLLLFNEDQVEMLFFIGFQDGEGLQFLEKLNNPEEPGANEKSRP